MNLIILATFVAIASAAKLDRHYLPPPSAKTAGGRPEDLQLPFAKNSLDQGPKGSSVNEFDGVVVDAALETAGPRQTDETGLGGPRNSYGSTNSKVGEAAFAAQPTAGFRLSPGRNSFDALHSASTENEVPQAFRESAIPQSYNGQFQRFSPSKDHGANTLRFESDVQTDRFKYAYDTDNGISASAIGVEANGVQAQGGFSYKSDDGQVYSVMYTADEGGYQPKGDHLPTPPPIPEEILRSIEQNARDEAAGVVDDGSYDATKYNAEGDYTESGNTNGQYNAKPLFSHGNRPELAASGSLVKGNNGFSKAHLNIAGESNIDIPLQGQSEQIFSSNNGRPGSNNVQPGVFDQTSFNNDGNSNEYLPPIRAGYTGKPQKPSSLSLNVNNAFQTPFSNFGNKPSQSQSNGQSQDHSQNLQANNQPGNNFQFSHYNAFQQKPGFGLNKPASLSQGTQGQSQFQFGSVSTIVPQFGIQPSSTSSPVNSQGQEQFQLSSDSSPTGQPSIELSTPFETSEYESNKDANIQSQSPSPSSSGFGSFTLQNLAKRPSQGQLNTQSSGSQQSGLGVTASPSLVSTSLNVQLPNSRPSGSNNYRPFSVSSSSVGSQFGNKLPFSQSHISNIQFSSTTQAPFGQNSQSQGQEVYQYNQPSKPYNNFISRPQGQNLLNNQPSSFGSGVGISSQGNSPFSFAQAQGNNKYPNPSTISSINQNSPFPSIKPNYNGITQASASSFGSVLPTQSLFANNKNTGSFSGVGSFAGFQQNLNSKPSSIAQQLKNPTQFQQSSISTTARPLEQSDEDKSQPELSANSEPSSIGQKYNGELYEYNKPEQSLPAPDSQDTESTDKKSNGQSFQSGNQPQFQGNTDNQLSPSFQFSSQQPFPRPQFGQNSLTNGNVQSLSQVPLQQGSRPFGLTGQFGSQFGQKVPQSGTQESIFGTGLIQNKYSQTRPNGNVRPIGACCQPSASLQISQPTQSTQNALSPDLSKQSEELPTSGNPDVPSAQSVAGQGEIFGSPNRKPPSFDKSGYHY